MPTPDRSPDGIDCTCMAFGQCECACGADWTPREVYELRDQVVAAPTAAPAEGREAVLWGFVERAFDSATTSACERMLYELSLPTDEPHMPLSWHINRHTAAQRDTTKGEK